jgi:hypothetical protein
MGGLFGGSPKAPEPPKATPMADEQVIKKKRQSAMLQEMQRGGRASTIMSRAVDMAGTSQTLGG